LAFGLGSYYATGEMGLFGIANVALGSIALLLAGVAAARRARGSMGSAARRILLAHLALCLAVLLCAIAIERLAARSALRLDWTVDRRFDLFPATKTALRTLPVQLTATLYHDPGDPRTRRTRMLLDEFARVGPVRVRERDLEQAQEDVDRFGIRGTNAVVLELRDAYELVDRPTEGELLEAILRLRGAPTRTLYATVGEGEGDLESGEPSGYSGLATTLRTEGYELRGLFTATTDRVPDDAAGLLVIGARRALRKEAALAIERYLEGGGRLVALLEPGVRSGLEETLERFGFSVPDALVIDPAGGPIEGAPAGVNPVVAAYASHPITRGLSNRTLTLFLRARPVEAVHKPEPGDELESLVFTSQRSWLDFDPGAASSGNVPRPPPGTPLQRYSLVAAGRYPRPSGEARIVAFGDADFATNAYLRSLYNLDLLVNAIHWALAREDAITIRPKLLTPDQDPLTPQQTLGMLYGIGLLVPELLLIGAAWAWLRRRGA
jgi:hypothetical protein